MLVFLASREDRETVGHEIVVLAPLKSFRDELRAKVVPLHAPQELGERLSSSKGRKRSRPAEPRRADREKRHGVARNADDELLAKVVCPHALKNSTIPVGLLKTKVNKKIVRQDQDPADREKVLVAGKMEDEEFRPEVLRHVRLDDERERGRGRALAENGTLRSASPGSR